MSRSSPGLNPYATLEIPRARRIWITFGVMMGLFLGALEATVVVTAMPTVISSLGGLEIYSWVYSIYFLTATVTVPLWGRLSDLYGRRLFYVAGIATFATGSVLCGLSRTMPQLIFFRFIQGTGAGALIPLGLTIVGDVYSLEERARIQGVFSGVWGVSSVAGPLLGGLITDHFSWRWVFFLNIPFGLAAGAIIWVMLREPAPERRRQVDAAGALLMIVLLTLFLVGLDRWKHPEDRLGSLALFAVSAILLALFLARERKLKDPILPLHLFRDRIFSAAAANGFFCGMAMFGAITFIPLFVQGALGTGATGAGWFLTPLTLAWVVLSIISSRLLLKIGYRHLVMAGMVSLTTGFFLLSRMTLEVSGLEMTGIMVLMGSGMGLAMIPMMLAVQNRVPRHHLGVATSVTQFFRSIGASVGIAVMGTVMVSRMTAQLSGLEGSGGELEAFARNPDAIVNPVARQQIPPAALARLQEIVGLSVQTVFLVGFLISLAALATAFLVPPGSAREHARRR